MLVLNASAFSFAQQCGYENKNAFVLNVHIAGSKQKIEGLKIYLTDENDRPYTFTATSVISDEPYRDFSYQDTCLFWSNTNNKKTKARKNKDHFRQFERAEDNYMVIFRESPDFANNPMQAPVYKARIVDVDGEANGGFFPTRYIYLPYIKSLNICYNDFHHSWDNKKKITTVDGQPYSPIDIALTTTGGHKVDMPDNEIPERMAFRLHYDTIQPAKDDWHGTLYNIRQVDIYDLKYLTPIQKIKKTKAFNIYENLLHDAIEYIDFYNDNPNNIKDFRYLIYQKEEKRLNATITKHLHYTFNEKRRRFEPDPLLNNYENVFYNPIKKLMGRIEYTATPNSFIQKIYLLINRKWTYQETIETKRYVPVTIGDTKVKRTAKDEACIQFRNEEWAKLYPVTFAKNVTNSSIHIKDTFRLHNICSDKIEIKNATSDHLNSFSFSKTMGPNSINYIYFDEVIYPHANFEFITRSLRIEFKDGSTKFVYFFMPLVIKERATLFYDDNNRISSFTIPSFPDYTVMEIQLHANGKMKAMGKRMKDDAAKNVEDWRHFDSLGKSLFPIITYTKTVTLQPQIVDQETPVSFKIKVRENGKWIVPTTTYADNNRTFYIFEKTDSIVAYTDSTAQGFSIDFDKLANSTIFQFYFLKADDPFLLIGGVKTPFSLSDHQYVLKWNYDKNANIYSPSSDDTLLNRMVRKIPGAKIIYHSRYVKGIDLSALSAKQRSQVLNVWLLDNNIQYICQMFGLSKSSINFHCNNMVTCRFKQGTPPEEVLTIAAALGFKRYSSFSSSDGELQSFIFNSKLIDQHFFKQFNALCQHPKVVYGHINQYMHISIDDHNDRNRMRWE